MDWDHFEDWLAGRQILKHGFLDEPVYGREGSVHVDRFFNSVVYV